MEAFGIWNLIKTALSAAEAPSSSGKSEENTTGKRAESAPPAPSNSSPEQGHTQGDFSPPRESRPNACEEYFLRHEQLKNHRKK